MKSTAATRISSQKKESWPFQTTKRWWAPGFWLLLTSKVATAAQLGIPQALRYTRHNDIAPRVGFAWRPLARQEKFAVRGGYGIDQLDCDAKSGPAEPGDVFPFTVSQTFNKTTNPNYLTLATPFPGAANLTGSVNNVAGYELNANMPQQSWNFTIEREDRPTPQAASGISAMLY